MTWKPNNNCNTQVIVIEIVRILTCSQTNARVTHESLPSHSPAHELRTHAQMRHAAQRTSHSRVTHLLTSYARTHTCADQRTSYARVTPKSLTCSRVTHACADAQRSATYESLPSHSPTHELRKHARVTHASASYARVIHAWVRHKSSEIHEIDCGLLITLNSFVRNLLKNKLCWKE